MTGEPESDRTSEVDPERVRRDALRHDRAADDGTARSGEVVGVDRGEVPETREDRRPGDPEDGVGELLPVVVAEVFRQLDISTHWAGPMPRPGDLQAYDDVVPGAAERILRIAESQTVDSSKRDDRIVDAEIASASASRKAAYTFTTFAFMLATFFFVRGSALAGCAFLGLPVLMLIRAFLPERSRRRSEDD